MPHMLDPESSRLVTEILPRFAPAPDMSPAEKRRLALEQGKLLQGEPPQLSHVEDIGVPAGWGTLAIRIYYPSDRPRSGWLLWTHGGGFVTGGLETHDTLCRRLALLSGQAVISLDYRLAPEHKFPAALTDCHTVLEWLHAKAGDLGLDPGRCAVGGSSAGGNLAAALALTNRDRGGPRLLHQLLVYPVVDATMSSPSHATFATGYQLTTEMMAHYLDSYVGAGTDLKDPCLSPLWAPDLSGLPPAHVVIAELDPLADEGAKYAERLAAAGVPVETTFYDGVMHGFFAQAGVLEKARTAQELACARVKAALDGA